MKRQPEHARTRRLYDGGDDGFQEYLKLIAACDSDTVRGRDFRDYLIALLEVGARQEEVSTIQVRDVRADHIFFPAEKVKLRKVPRRVPISALMRDVLDRRLRDAGGRQLPADAYVFGDEVGRHRKLRSYFKRIWNETKLKAHGHTPQLTKNGGFTPECLALLRTIDLHQHDLRREWASRLAESGAVSLSTLMEQIGHGKLSTTSTYVAASRTKGVQEIAALDILRAPQIAAVRRLVPVAIRGNKVVAIEQDNLSDDIATSESLRKNA